MALSFSIGINQSWGALAMMQSPGFYWINIDRTTDAERFCKQIITALPVAAHAALICHKEIPHSLLTDFTHLSVKKLPLFTLVEKKEAILNLTTDLMRSLKTKRQLFLLLINSTIWQSFSKVETEAWVKKTSQWLDAQQSTLLILNHGPGTNQLKNYLLSQHRFLDGLSQLKWQEDYLQYLVSWWATESGFTANQSLTIDKESNDWSIQLDIKQKRSITQNDEFLFLVDQSILEGAMPPSENWQLFNSNELLVKQAKPLQAATVIFSLSDNNKIEELGRKIHDLRVHCGDALKIVVREMNNNIRYSDERLLLACGTNLTVPYSVSLPKFLTMVDSIQGQQFNRHVPPNFDGLLTLMQPIENKGYLPLQQFAELVLSRIHNTFLPENGKGILVALVPEENVAVEQALSLCELKRSGDIATLTENRLFLFLSTCALSDLDKALNYIFQQPVNVIFSSQVAWDLDLQIITEIKLLQSNSSSLKQEKIKLGQEKLLTEKSAPQRVPRRVPECITLSINTKARK